MTSETNPACSVDFFFLNWTCSKFANITHLQKTAQDAKFLKLKLYNQ